MSAPDVRVEHAGPVTTVTIDRPALRNAYRTQTCQELAAAVTAFGSDDERRVLVLTGAGGSFCSGGDLTEAEEIEAAHQRSFAHGMTMREGMHAVIRALDLCDKPTVARIDGPAISGGLALALCCDFRVGSDRARLGDVSGRVGLLPDEGGAWLFPRVMGPDRALRMSLLHEIYDAATALELGLLTDLVPADRLDETVDALTGQLAAKAPLAARMTKRLMRAARRSSLGEALDAAELAVDLVNGSADVAEGVDAFLTKRTPHFTGR